MLPLITYRARMGLEWIQNGSISPSEAGGQAIYKKVKSLGSLPSGSFSISGLESSLNPHLNSCKLGGPAGNELYLN